ncbi:putative reverse transcriptase domain-containing protein [Tanacetum coccineum]
MRMNLYLIRLVATGLTSTVDAKLFRSAPNSIHHKTEKRKFTSEGLYFIGLTGTGKSGVGSSSRMMSVGYCRLETHTVGNEHHPREIVVSLEGIWMIIVGTVFASCMLCDGTRDMMTCSYLESEISILVDLPGLVDASWCSCRLDQEVYMISKLQGLEWSSSRNGLIRGFCGACTFSMHLRYWSFLKKLEGGLVVLCHQPEVTDGESPLSVGTGICLFCLQVGTGAGTFGLPVGTVPSLSDVDTLEVDAQEVESFDLGSGDLTLKSLEAKSFELTSEDLSLLSQETKSLDTELESPEPDKAVMLANYHTVENVVDTTHMHALLLAIAMVKQDIRLRNVEHHRVYLTKNDPEAKDDKPQNDQRQLNSKGNNRASTSNQRGNRASGRVYQLGAEGTVLDNNVVNSTFLINNVYASVLFDIADGKSLTATTILRGCTLNLQNHTFKIDLLPIELGSFDIIIGIDWMSEPRMVVMCYEKYIRIPYGNDVLIVRGERSRVRSKSRLEVISSIRTQKYIKKGCPVFLIQVTRKEEVETPER